MLGTGAGQGQGQGQGLAQMHGANLGTRMVPPSPSRFRPLSPHPQTQGAGLGGRFLTSSLSLKSGRPASRLPLSRQSSAAARSPQPLAEGSELHDSGHFSLEQGWGLGQGLGKHDSGGLASKQDRGWGQGLRSLASSWAIRSGRLLREGLLQESLPSQHQHSGQSHRKSRSWSGNVRGEGRAEAWHQRPPPCGNSMRSPHARGEGVEEEIRPASSQLLSSFRPGSQQLPPSFHPDHACPSFGSSLQTLVRRQHVAHASHGMHGPCITHPSAVSFNETSLPGGRCDVLPSFLLCTSPFTLEMY